MNDTMPSSSLSTLLEAAAIDPVHLCNGGTSAVIDVSAASPPVIVHWGESLAGSDAQTLRALARAAAPQRVSGGLDETARLSLVPLPSEGWLGTPGIEGHRDGTHFSAAFALEEVRHDATSASIRMVDAEAALRLTVELRIGSSGLLHQRLTLDNLGRDRYELLSMLATVPIPWDATEILDTTGRHLRERNPQRRSLGVGVHLRESRRGRPGADSTLFLAAGRPGFGFESGRVHVVHIAWSGNHRVLAERTTSGDAALMGGDLYAPGEVILEPGESTSTPWLIGSWGLGLDDAARRFHDEWRARPQHPRTPRPITINTWEAVYFDHSLDRLLELATVAAGVGVERFVLDDGWFHGRRDDSTSLGDWTVDQDVWPEGLHPLARHVRELGMEFGLWVEPEMISPDSDLARAHPDWILRARTGLPRSARAQQALDLSNPAAYSYIRERLMALLDEYRITYLKWDHNRDLVEPGSGGGGAPRARANVVALYRLLDELKSAYPGLEIESCASGGARVDLGILDRTDRIWTSDCLDPLERLENQRYTGLVVPPEMMGMHLTSPQVHSTGRTVSLGMSGAVALFGHFGIEWDLTSASPDAVDAVAGWVALAKRLRTLVATGRVVNVDALEHGIDVRGVVSDDARHAAFTLVQYDSTASHPPGRVRFPGLDADTRYRVEVISPPEAHTPGQSPLSWLSPALVMTGRELAAAGLRPPVQFPQQAIVVECTAVG